MQKPKQQYIPALRFDWLTNFYDPLIRWFLRESTFKRRLIQLAQIENGHRVLDIGCGTGTLTLMTKRAFPKADVLAIDGDAHILDIARRKAQQENLVVTFERGMSFNLPYPDGSFDRVVSSLLFHHLTRENKERTLREIFRVLRPGGELHVADWGKPHNTLMRAAFYLVQLLDGFTTTQDNVNGLLPAMLVESGFRDVTETSRFSTVFGTLSIYSGRKVA